MSTHPFRRATLRLGALLVLAALATHAHVLWGGWVRDDYALILDNPAVRNLGTIPAQLTQPFLGIFWRPSVTIAYTVEYALWGLRPAGFHATNLLLHAGATLLVFALWRRVSEDARVPVLAALIFAVHGAHYQPAVIADRTGLMATTFGLLAWWCAVRAGDAVGGVARALAWAGAALAAYAIALGAKEEAVVVPVLVLAVGAAQPWRTDGSGHWKRVLPVAVPMLGMAVGYLLLRGRILGGPGLLSVALPGIGARVASMPAWAVHHWRDVVAPFWLDVDYRGAVWPLLSTVRALLGVAVVAAAGAAAWRARHARPEVLVGLVWWGLAWLPTSNLVPIYAETATTHVFMPPHLLYFGNAALAGVVAAVGVGVVRARARIGWSLVAVFVLVQAAVTVRMNYVWMDDVRLYRYVLAAHLRHPLMWRNLGLALVRRGAYEDAMRAYAASLAARPSPEAWNGLGLARRLAGDSAGAAAAYGEALALDPGHTNACLNLAALLQAAGRDVEAIGQLERGLAHGGDPALLRARLGIIHRDAGRLAQAEAVLRAALEDAPANAPLWNTLGTVLADRGDRAGALDAWDRAEALAPGMTPAAENRRLFLSR